MPAPGAGSKSFGPLFIFCSYAANPCHRGLGASYAHVIHKAFPTDWGQLVHCAEPFQRNAVGGYLSVMAQGFQGCRLQRSVQGFPTELSTAIEAPHALLQSGKKTWENHPQSAYGQKTNNALQPS
ncbi:hypothetical protein [Pseudomonas sp. NPDC089401]|uniref:hypothetical protein n=1 Tax=Pseudomonas sp. NPDC089401 TaxID=3364462 RepID=UPI0037F2B1F6